MDSLNSINVIYRLQGFFELRDASAEYTLAHAQMMLRWTDAVEQKTIIPPIAYIRGKLEMAVFMELSGKALARFMDEMAEYLDTVFEHYAPADYPGDKALLQPTKTAAEHVTLKPIVIKLSPRQFCYRTQGYFELAEAQTLSAKQAEQVHTWLKRLNTDQSSLLSLEPTLTPQTRHNEDTSVCDALRAYLREYIDPHYTGNPQHLSQIHTGQTNPLSYAKSG